MKTLLFLILCLCCFNSLFAQLVPNEINCPCKEPRFIWRSLTDGVSLFFIKQGDRIAYTHSDDFKSDIYFINKSNYNQDSFYFELKKNLLDSTNLEKVFFLEEVKIDKDSLAFFYEIKNNKGLFYLLNEYLEPNSFKFEKKKISNVFLYFLFQNCIPIKFTVYGELTTFVFEEWYPDLYLELLKTRTSKEKYEKFKESLKRNPYE